ncbi:MAG: DUF885 domain-containing protein [Steroidobacteraceae bacterium]|jgi:uncharacterized protein (DUF885 family)
MIRFLRSVPVGFAIMALLGCGSAPPPPIHPPIAPAPREQLARLIEQYWTEYLRLNPQRLPEGAARRFDGASGYDISAQFLADSLALERTCLGEVLELQRPRLDADSQLNYDIFKRERELAVESFTYPSELLPVNPFRSMPQLFAQTGAGAGQYAILSAKDYEHWRARMDAYVRWTGQAIANMREGMRRGYALPRVLVEEMLPQLAALGEDSPANVFYQPLSSIPATIADSERIRLSQGITAGVRERILPAYRTLLDFLRGEYLPRARETVGLSALPLGGSWYAFLVKQETDTSLTPAEIHRFGQAEVERLHGRLQALLAEAGNPHPPDRSADELLSRYGELKVQVASAMPALFSQAPQADFAIRAVEPFRQAIAPALSYQRGTPNGGTAATLYVNTAATAARPATAAALFLQQAVPGHQYQLAIQQERSDLPAFRRFGGDPAFVEGWSLYAASLGEEMGLYGDPDSKIAGLMVELGCAAGLVIDTGLHAQGWTREQAIDYLQTQLSIEEAAARTAVDRDLSLPGEALACGLGGRRIRGLRARAEQTLGTRFDVRAFHAELLDEGAMPLNILESRVDRWLGGIH